MIQTVRKRVQQKKVTSELKKITMLQNYMIRVHKGQVKKNRLSH